MDIITTYFALTWGLLTDGHVVCAFYGAWFIFCPVFLGYAMVRTFVLTPMRDRREARARKARYEALATASNFVVAHAVPAYRGRFMEHSHREGHASYCALGEHSGICASHEALLSDSPFN